MEVTEDANAGAELDGLLTRMEGFAHELHSTNATTVRTRTVQMELEWCYFAPHQSDPTKGHILKSLVLSELTLALQCLDMEFQSPSCPPKK
eukprot:3402546-Amphidinium_carterae.1